ncbi:hypothetical protein Gotri_025151 [Gossypium trilobum]|uniref:Uncharacterized protein n=1 Tax=Gossypium trilobum TaxID=34281 RepID=A0A7J9FRN5_9ROSI|nr:hypothetical protein [Gossypium trilobum]
MEENLISMDDGGGVGDLDVNMVTDVILTIETSWRDKLFGGGFVFDNTKSEDFTFSEGDILKSTVNGMSVIDFSERIQNILVKDKETTIENLISIDDGGGGRDPNVNRVIDVILVIETSWNDKLFGGRFVRFVGFDIMKSEDFTFSEGDILKSTINGMPVIDFSEQIQKILVKDMENTVVVKLLGHDIGYTMLYNFLTSYRIVMEFDSVLCVCEIGYLKYRIVTELQGVENWLTDVKEMIKEAQVVENKVSKRSYLCRLAMDGPSVGLPLPTSELVGEEAVRNEMWACLMQEECIVVKEYLATEGDKLRRVAILSEMLKKAGKHVLTLDDVWDKVSVENWPTMLLLYF